LANNAAQRPAASKDASRGPPRRLVAATVKASGDQLVQLSVAGLMLAVLAPPVAVTPVRAGIEK
jgi:hypothetical protein